MAPSPTLIQDKNFEVFSWKGVLLFLIFVKSLSECESTQLTRTEGQDAKLTFPYPCNTSQVTLQQSNRLPFYRSSDSSPSLLNSQVNRFTVITTNNMNECSIDLTISNLIIDDQGTYILFVYKDGRILDDLTRRIWLEVTYPPGKAVCVESNDKGGNWTSLDCTANIGNPTGKIECYQKGEWMPPFTKPQKSGNLLEQTILVRKFGSVFCCVSIIDEVKERCECADSVIFLADDESNNPCPKMTTSPSYISTGTMNKEGSSSSTRMTITIPQCISNQNVIALIILFVIIIILLLINLFKKNSNTCTNNNNQSDDSSKSKNRSKRKSSRTKQPYPGLPLTTSDRNKN